MFNMPTSGPLSPTVSLERRKLEQAGAQPGQEQQAAAGMGSPISGDLAQLIQLNRMLQQQGTMQQQANAAPSTVAQDLMQRAGQQMQPQMPPQMQQMPPQLDPRQQGIAQLPQEIVGNGMAAGGIVAFNEGGYSFNMMDDVEEQRRKKEQEAREKAAAEMEAKRQATLKAIAQRNAVSGKGEGLAEFVPTLSYSKRNLHDVAIENAGFDVQKDYGKIRKKMEEESGLAGIWKKQQEEQERLKAEASPEEQKRAFWNNLAARLADQSGQRGVSRSSRIAQMLGAVGGARSSTEEEFKKRNAELNKAANDLQEKQAMYRATGAMADREAMAKATQNYEKAALDKQTAERLEKKDAATEAREARLDKQATRELDLRAARDQREADHQQKMLDITSGKEPISRARSLMDSYNSEIKALISISSDPMTDPAAKTEAIATLAEVRRRLNEVQSVLRQGLPGMSAAAPAPTGGIRPIPLADYLKQKS